MVFGWLTSKFGANAAATRAVARLENATKKYGNSNTRKKARNASDETERITTLLKDAMTRDEEVLAETKTRCVTSVKDAQTKLNTSRAAYNKAKDTILSKIGRFATYGVANRSKLVNVQQARQHAAVINSYSKLKASQGKADAAAKAAEEAAKKTKKKLEEAETARKAEAEKRAAAAAAAAAAIAKGATTVAAAAVTTKPTPPTPPTPPEPGAPNGNNNNNNNNNNANTKERKLRELTSQYANVTGNINFNSLNNSTLKRFKKLVPKTGTLYQKILDAEKKRNDNPRSPSSGGGRTRRSTRRR